MNGTAGAVKLEIPASPEYVLLARLAAAGLASRLGLNYDDVDDLRVAVAELCQLLVGEEGRDGVVTLTYSVDSEGITVEGVGSTALTGTAEPDDLSLHLLAALADEHDVALEGGQPRVRLVKKIKP